MHLPLESPTAAANIPPAGPAERILLVDDEITLRNLHSIALSRAGYQVDTAKDGADAWKCLNDHSYDLLITDNRMPKMTGVELIAKLRGIGMTLPVILMSGSMPMEELARHPGLKIEAMLCKLSTITEFLAIVKGALHPQVSMADDFRPVSEFVKKEKRIPLNLKEDSVSVLGQIKKSARILVVDDDEQIRSTHLTLLKNFGYEAHGVTDGAAGWEALQADAYNLVLTDNKMPGMTGVEMIAKLRAHGMTVPVIMATSTLPSSEFANRPWLMPEATLERPFSQNELLKTVRRVLEPEHPY